MRKTTKGMGRLGMCLLAAGAAVLVSAGAARAASRAIIVTGWDAKQANRDAMVREADLAERIYRDKGYAITRVDHVSKATLLMLLCQGDASILFYAGHGAQANDRGDGHAMLELVPRAWPGGYLYFQEVIDAVPLNCRQRFRQVVLNACSQRQVGWAAAFPMAVVWGFDKPITNATCYNDLKQNGAARTATKGARGEDDGGPGLQPSPPVDPRIASAIPAVFDFDSRTFRAEAWWEYAEMPWRMDAPLASAFGDRRFNVLIVGETPDEFSHYKGLEVSGGGVVAEQLHPFASPDFEVVFTEAAFAAATADIDALPGLFGAGESVIASNTTGVPDHVLFAGVSAVLFGLGGAIPACAGDADGDRLVGLSDIAVILTHWGISGVPGQLGDVSGDGHRGLADVARVIANWGGSCE